MFFKNNVAIYFEMFVMMMVKQANRFLCLLTLTIYHEIKFYNNKNGMQFYEKPHILKHSFVAQQLHLGGLSLRTR